MPYDDQQAPIDARETISIYATFTRVFETFAFATTDDGRDVYVPAKVVQVCDAREGSRRFMRVTKNTRPPEGKGRSTELFACFAARNDMAPLPLPENCDLPCDNGRIYFYREADGEWAWGDEPPQAGEVAYVFRFEKVEGA